ncbi:aldehyde dehydrogenase (NAD(P)(+)) ald5 [Tulasnella sp. JGI-2019a]|nr:aldehyde dehydrogenase (NAD(P)(+)) ald5 [Tulasnella sp. JGI-2019a]
MYYAIGSNHMRTRVSHAHMAPLSRITILIATALGPHKNRSLRKAHLKIQNPIRKMASVTDFKITLPSGKTVTTPTGLFIDNKFIPSESGKTFKTINPVTEEEICEVHLASVKDVDVAVASSRKAFEQHWGMKVSPTERGRLVGKLADLMERDAGILAELESLDNGKPVSIAKDGDIADSVACLRYFAGWADKLAGQTIPVPDANTFAFTRHEPIGVCAQIIPWNYPIMMWAWKTAPALAAGCTVIMKPSELTPLTALKLCELIVEAGFPPGVLNCLPSTGPVGGAALAEHMEVDKIAFTGSTITGRKIMEASAKSNLKKVTLELGGKSPNIVFPSADLDKAAEVVSAGIMSNMGQDCTAGSRAFVHASIYDEFMKKLVAHVESFQKTVGDPTKEETQGGPLVSEAQRDKVWGYIESGIQEQATVITGGTKWKGKGFYIVPTILGNATKNMKIFREEIFGPVLAVGKFETEEEAIQMANDTTYGLAAGLQSNDHKQIIRVSSALKAGTVWINTFGYLFNQVPFGGFKVSGMGRELGAYAISEYTAVKAVHWNFAE